MRHGPDVETRLLGFVVKVFVSGEGWREDRFVLRQAAIECAQRCGGSAYQCTQEEIGGELLEEEQQPIWPEDEVAEWNRDQKTGPWT